MSGGDEAAPPRAGRREILALAVLALPTLLLALDASVLYLALPHLTVDLGAGATEQLWIMDVYGFLIAGFLVTMGTLGDRVGSRRLLIIGAVAFGVTSLLAAYASSPQMLIAARAAQGIAGATLMPSTLALINHMFRDPRQRSLAIGVWMSCFLGGMAVGPVVGGVMLQYFWWGSVFLLGVPVMAVLVVSAPVVLPERRDKSAGRIDLTSVVLSLTAILPIIYGLKVLAADGPSLTSVVAVVVGVVAGVWFVRRQRRLDAPLVDVTLFRSRTFSAALAIMLLAGVMGGFYFLVAGYLQLVEGFSPLRSGLFLLAPTVAAIGSSMLAPVIARRVPPGKVIAGGMVLAAVGLLLLTQIRSSAGLAALLAGLILTDIGAGPLGALSTDLIVGAAPEEKAGSAAALSETSAEFGVGLGVAVIGSIGAAVYRTRLGDSLHGEVPADVVSSASDGIAGAVTAAQRLPSEVGAVVLERAGAAFADGLTVAAVVCGAAALALAVVAVVAFRHVPSYGSQQDPVEVPESATAS
ncbi:MFS transporter [Micromonospora sediminicola]|uniref:MFS transporter n=1 Tax=Micromonospora sediminicola TaxID=946078 RepID=UPI0033F206FE